MIMYCNLPKMRRVAIGSILLVEERCQSSRLAMSRPIWLLLLAELLQKSSLINFNFDSIIENLKSRYLALRSVLAAGLKLVAAADLTERVVHYSQTVIRALTDRDDAVDSETEFNAGGFDAQYFFFSYFSLMNLSILLSSFTKKSIKIEICKIGTWSSKR